MISTPFNIINSDGEGACCWESSVLISTSECKISCQILLRSSFVNKSTEPCSQWFFQFSSLKQIKAVCSWLHEVKDFFVQHTNMPQHTLLYMVVINSRRAESTHWTPTEHHNFEAIISIVLCHIINFSITPIIFNPTHDSFEILAIVFVTCCPQLPSYTLFQSGLSSGWAGVSAEQNHFLWMRSICTY